MQLSLFSVSYAGYWGQDRLDLQSFIAKAAELGYDAIMVAGKRPHLSPLDADPAVLESVARALDKHEVQCAAVAGYTDLAPLEAAEVPYLEMQISYIESLARIASALGASLVRVFTAYETTRLPVQVVWQHVVRSLREMCDRAAAHGVTLAVQNHHDLGVHSDAMLEILADVDRPNCKLGFDAWSPALCGEDLYETARKMAPHTVMSTSADYIRLPRFRYAPELVNYRPATPEMVRAVKFGQGFIDYEAFFRGLVEGGFDGILNYEMCSPIRGGGALENLDGYAKQFVHWMKDAGFADNPRPS